MRAISASELLSIWERGQAQHPVQRALSLLHVACPETSLDGLVKLSIGQRDRLLLTLREWTFGSQLVSLATCPRCSDRLELAFDIADITVAPPAAPAEVLSLKVGDYDVQFRLPNSLDLIAIADQKDIAVSRQLLLNRCLLAIHHHQAETPTAQLPTDVADAVVAQMAQVDSQADVQLALSCPACGHQWQEIFDILSFFWSEINAWAYRILREVHLLASAYGWHEADILAMSPWRRQLYLEMVST